MPLRAKFYITLILASGIAGLAVELRHFASSHPNSFWLVLLITVLTSGLKVPLPTVTVTMSVNFFLILVGIAKFDLPEALVIAGTGAIVQCLWQAKSLRFIQVAFSTCSTCLAVIVAHAVFHGPLMELLGETNFLLLALTAAVYFVANTFMVAGVVAITAGRPFYQTWLTGFSWSTQYHMAASVVAWQIVILSAMNSRTGWQAPVVLLVLVYFVHRQYKIYLNRLEHDKKHVEEIAGLHLRTIEALALAIEAKDSTTHDHLRRVRVYASEIGREMGISTDELDALQAAALLHDIGKLAVPEHIISKPGRLTPEEFDKMKIHPLVGAEILEQVKFPYPVAPIVRAHHEKWDGTGYPFGLAGTDIPVGARIISAVDCLDALASDRQYRRALPLDDAMAIIVKESGKAFDPVIVDILKRRYIELEHMAVRAGGEKSMRLSMDLKIEHGLAPATGFAATTEIETVHMAGSPPSDPMSTIAAASQEAQMLYELTQDLGNSLGLQEALAFVGVRLKRLIPYETLAIYIRRDEKLTPEYVCGENLRLFNSLEIPVGQGLSGWVAENNKAILNGNPSVEAGYLKDSDRSTTLRAALAVPLEGVNGVLGVLALYRTERDGFSNENLRILQAVSSKLALAIENALSQRLLETSITTDYLTNLPNARSLFLSLDHELSRAARTERSLAVVVADLDGFKQINDRFGHLAGNRVLRIVANGLREYCGPNDYVARLGGDEFVMLIPAPVEEELEAKVERMRAVARKAGEATPEPSVLSISVGIASFPADGTDAEQLLAEADRRMYKGKRLRKKERSTVITIPVAPEAEAPERAVAVS